MYFDVMSADPDDRFLADGLVDDLIVDLTRLEKVHVASRADVQPFKDRALPPRTIAPAARGLSAATCAMRCTKPATT
jgi:TolB-like protein